MIRRAMPAVLAAIFLSTSGLAGVALHLCGMEGLVRSSCCCHKSEHEAPPVQLKRVDECCGSVFSAGEHPVVSGDGVKPGVDAPLSVAVAASVPELIATSLNDECFAWARGPPARYGPPLYIQHCSYLN